MPSSELPRFGTLDDVDVEMILQILADARQVEHHRHAERAQLAGRTDAGEEQKLRRVDRAAGEHHFLSGSNSVPPAAACIFDADRAAVLDEVARRLRLGEDGEVFPRRHRMQIGRRRAPAPAVFLRHLEEPAAELRGAVEIRIERQARLLRRRDEGVA